MVVRSLSRETRVGFFCLVSEVWAYSWCCRGFLTTPVCTFASPHGIGSAQRGCRASAFWMCLSLWLCLYFCRGRHHCVLCLYVSVYHRVTYTAPRPEWDGGGTCVWCIYRGCEEQPRWCLLLWHGYSDWVGSFRFSFLLFLLLLVLSVLLRCTCPLSLVLMPLSLLPWGESVDVYMKDL